MSKPYLLSLDQGTTSSRSILFDRDANIVSKAQQDFTQIFPKPGWVEHDPMEIWESQLATIRNVINDQVSVEDIAALGITNQRETVVIWDKTTGEPIYNAIVWQDRRTAAFCDDLKVQGKEEGIQQKTGLVIDAYFSASKIAWILDHVDDARAKAEKGELCFGTVDTWLIYQLTKGNVFVTDVTNASRTMLFNIHSLQWDDELLELFSIPKRMLPTVKESSEIYGHVHKDILEGNIPIAGIAGDQQAALFGQLCTTKGMAKNTYGTGCFLLMNTGEKPVTSTNKLLTTVAWKINGKTTYALEGSVFIGGAAVQWLRDGLQLITDAKEVEEKANQVEDNGGVYFVPALTGLGAPYWDPYAKGAIFGIDRGTTQGHIAAATLQGIAFQVHDIVRAMEQDAKAKCIELRVDGGAAANDYLMQFQADLFDFKVVRPKMLETTALGAAYLAGLAVGIWDDLSDLTSQWQRDGEFEPQMTQDKREKHLDQWNAAVRQTRGWK